MEPTCTICTTPLSPTRTVTFPCNHAHCLPCLRRNWDLALNSAAASTNPAATFRPVQCCPGSRLPVSTIRRALGLDFNSSLRRGENEGANRDHGDKIALYRARMAEHDAARGSRLYCHDPRCGSFIPELLRDIRVGRCRACRARTCVRCGERAHTSPSGAGGLKGRRWCEAGSGEGGGGGGGVEGATNTGESERKRRLRMEKKEQEEQEAFIRVVKEMGWKCCPACKRYVEKTEGCNHIHCICGCHFCYRCGRAPYGNHGECAM